MKRFLSIGSMFALALIIGVVFAPKARGQFGDTGNLSRQIQEGISNMQEGLRGLNSSPHEDLNSCAVKDISLSSTSLSLNIKANCDGTDRQVVFMSKDKDISKMIYSEAIAAFLSNSKLNFQKVSKFEAGFFVADTMVLTR